MRRGIIAIARMRTRRRCHTCVREGRFSLRKYNSTPACSSARTHQWEMAEQALRGVLQFGVHSIPRAQVFLLTPLSFAFTNRRPILPGHVLVATRRPVERLQQLSSEEVRDLFACTHRVAPVVSRLFGGTSLTISLQDGPDAGQTVKQVHVHIIPRRAGDLQRNDDIYHKLEEHDSRLEGEEEFRSLQEMADEAAKLAPFFHKPH